MLSFAVVRALVARVPSIVWLVLGVGVLLLAGYAWAAHRGERIEQRRVSAAAHRDTTARAMVRVDTATAHSDRAIARARAAKTRADGERVAVRAAAAAIKSERERLEEFLAVSPPPVVDLVRDQQAQIARDSLQITRDSITQAVQLAAVDSLRRERLARQELDTARVRERDDVAPDARSTPVLAIGVGAGGGAALGTLVAGPLGAAVGAGVGALIGWLVGR